MQLETPPFLVLILTIHLLRQPYGFSGSNYNFDNYSFSVCGLACSGSIKFPIIFLDKFSIYPNPTKENINISVDNFNEKY